MNTSIRGESPKPATIERCEFYQTDEKGCGCPDFKHRHKSTCKHMTLLLALLIQATQHYRTTYNRCSCDDWHHLVNLDFNGRCQHQRALWLSVDPATCLGIAKQDESEKCDPALAWMDRERAAA